MEIFEDNNLPTASPVRGAAKEAAGAVPRSPFRNIDNNRKWSPPINVKNFGGKPLPPLELSKTITSKGSHKEPSEKNDGGKVFFDHEELTEPQEELEENEALEEFTSVEDSILGEDLLKEAGDLIDEVDAGSNTREVIYNELPKGVDKQEEEAASVQEDGAVSVDELKSRVASLEKDVINAKTNAETWEAEYWDIKQQGSNLYNSYEVKCIRIRELGNSIAALEAKIAESDASLANSMSELSEEKAKTSDLTEKLSSARGRFKASVEDYKKLEQEYKALQQTFHSTGGRSSTAKTATDIASVRAEKEKADKEIKRLNSEVESLKKQLQEAVAHAEDSQAQMMSVASCNSCGEMEQKLIDANSAHEVLQGEVDNLKASLEEAEATKNVLDNDLKMQKSRHMREMEALDQMYHHEDYKSKYAEAAKEIIDLKAQLVKMVEMFEGSEAAEAFEAEEKLAEVHAENAALLEQAVKALDNSRREHANDIARAEQIAAREVQLKEKMFIVSKQIIAAEATTKDMADSLQRLSERTVKCESENSRLQTELSSASAKCNDLEAHLARERGSALEVFSGLKTDILVHDVVESMRMEASCQEKAAFEAEIASLESRLHEESSRFTNMKAKSDLLESQLSELKKQAELQQESFEEAEKSSKALADTMTAEFAASMAGETAARQDLEIKLEEAQLEIERLNGTADSMMTEYTEVSSKNDDLSMQVQKVIEEAAGVQAQLTEQVDAKSVVDEQLKNAEEQIRVFEEEKNTMSQKIKELELESESLVEKLNQSEKTNGEVQEQVQKLTEDLNARVADVEGLKKVKDDLKSTLHMAEDKIRKLELDSQLLQNDKQQLMLQMDILTTIDSECTGDSMSRLTSEKAALQKEVNDVRAQHDATTKELDLLKLGVEKMTKKHKQQLKVLQSNNEKAEEEVDELDKLLEHAHSVLNKHRDSFANMPDVVELIAELTKED